MSAVNASGAWHLIQTKPRQESRAMQNLQNQGFTCFLPTFQVERLVRGKVEVMVEPLFSRYLFIRLSTVDRNWSSIRSTRGVSRLVAFGGRFAILPDEYVDALTNTVDGGTQRLFEPGERVAIDAGPFAGLEGIYQLPDGEARALVLIELMNQPQMLRLAVEALRKAA